MAPDDEAQLTEAIYDAAFEPSLLDDVLARMRARLNASISVMFTYDGSRTGLWHLNGIDPAVLFIPYAEHYHEDDVYRQGLIAQGLLRTGTVYNAERIVDAATLQRSAFINELMRPNDLGPICASPVYVPPEGSVAQLSFFRPAKAEEFGEEELNFLERMVPHFGRAARLRLRLEQQARPPSWTLELLDALPWGVVLVDARARPIFANREAERILAQADGLRRDGRGLYAEHPDDARRLQSALAGAVAKRGDGASPGAEVPIRRPSGAPTLLLTVVPLGRRILDVMSTSSLRAAVHVVDPAALPVATAERRRTFFGLTPAEAALASALAAGKTLQEHADTARLTCETARWRLKQILAKTDTHRQAELVRLVLTSAVLR